MSLVDVFEKCQLNSIQDTVRQLISVVLMNVLLLDAGVRIQLHLKYYHISLYTHTIDGNQDACFKQ